MSIIIQQCYNKFVIHYYCSPVQPSSQKPCFVRKSHKSTALLIQRAMMYRMLVAIAHYPGLMIHRSYAMN